MTWRAFFELLAFGFLVWTFFARTFLLRTFFFGASVRLPALVFDAEEVAGSPCAADARPKRKPAAKAAAGTTDALCTTGIIRGDRGSVNPKKPWGSMGYADSAYSERPWSRGSADSRLPLAPHALSR